MLGLVMMFAWENALVFTTPVTRTGRLVLAAAVVALLVETHGGAAIWDLRRRLLTGPGLLLVLALAMITVFVAISSSTLGCRCGGSADGLFEVEAWLALSFAVTLIDPGSSVPLLGAAALGCFVAAVLALAGVHAASEMDLGNSRLAGTYGNSNYFAAALALGLPLIVAATWQSRAPVIRAAALVTGLTVSVALVLSYSRSGILAAAAGVAVTVVLLAPARRRLVLAAGLLAIAGAAGWLIYPTFARNRTRADLGHPIANYRATDVTGWTRVATGPIGNGPSQLSNAGADVLRVVAMRGGEGVSFPLGVAPLAGKLRLQFDVRALGRRLAFRYGMEDNLTGNGPAYGKATVGGSWSGQRITWRPALVARHAQAYFWVNSPGSFELRRLFVSRNGGPPTPLPGRLLGPPDDVQRQVRQIEQRYINSRTSAARIAVSAFVHNPVFGIGWEQFPVYASTRSGFGAIASHDEYLRFAAELGLPGLLAIGLLCIAAAWAAFGTRANRLGVALAGLLVAGAIDLGFGNLLEAPNVVLPLATAIGVAVAISQPNGSAGPGRTRD
jgi:O-antigen ligase